MTFNSLDFALFLPIVFVLYWLVRRNLTLQNLLLVVASYVFYGWWDWRFLFLLGFSTVVDYLVGQGLSKVQESAQRKSLLWVSIGINLGLLAFFKYYGFFVESFVEAFSLFGFRIQRSSLNIILPVGISFYTFQTLSYTIDVYKKRLEPTNDFIAFSAYIGFFPQLVAGPIERATQLLPQFYKKRTLHYYDAVEGFHKILWGLFKKVVIADRLALVVNEIYSTPQDYHALTLAFGTLLFAFQIYGDFSGYSDIAIGTARLFGFELMANFSTPYFSKSLSEFWRRWHISLSTWFRDYVYIPLGGSRTTVSRWYLHVMLVFTLSGLWHGANWTFILWGALHGFFLMMESVWKWPRSISYMNNRLSGIRTFALVCLGWVFFRANSVQDAFYILGSIFNVKEYSVSLSGNHLTSLAIKNVYAIDVALSAAGILFLLCAEYFIISKGRFTELRFIYRLPIYVAGIWSIYIFGVFERNEFIYFQF